jgi:hypothetical protein
MSADEPKADFTPAEPGNGLYLDQRFRLRKRVHFQYRKPVAPPFGPELKYGVGRLPTDQTKSH